MKSKLLERLFPLLAIVWVILIGADYVNKHPYYPVSFQYFKFQNLALFFFLFSIACVVIEKSKLGSRFLFTGLGSFLTFTIFALASGLSFSKYAAIEGFGMMHMVAYTTTIVSSGLAVLSICLSALLYGSVVKLKQYDHPIIHVGIGLMFIAAAIFGLGLLGLSNQWSLSILLGLSLIVGWRRVKSLVLDVSIKDLKPSNLRPLGLISGITLLFYLTVNFVYIQSPFPIGFDSRNFYMNIARQVSLKEGLIYGYRPYNWALIISIGYTVFKSTAVALSISFSGYVLSLIAFYQLATKALKINVNYTLFALLLLTVSPAITNQLYVELKTDFGLLFFQSLTLLVSFIFIKSKAFTTFINSENVFLGVKEHISYVVLVGLFLGFGLGIKMTNMFLLFSILIGLIWLISEHRSLVAAAILLTMAIFIGAKLDDLSGLRQYHKAMNMVFGLFGLSGIALLVYALIKHRLSTLKALVFTATIGVTALLPLTPWLIKNATETQSLNPNALLNGANPGPKVSIGSLNANYQNKE